MTEAEILDGIAELARRELGYGGPLASSLRLVEDLELDSLRLLTLAVAVENHFRVRLTEDEAGIVTVGDLVASVRRRLEESAAGPIAADPGATG